MSQLIKGSKEWFAAKAQARKDLDLRLSLGLPHSSEPLDGTVPMIETGNAAAPKTPKPRKPRAKKVAKKAAAEAK